MWNLIIRGQKRGPYNAQELKALLKSGIIDKEQKAFRQSPEESVTVGQAIALPADGKSYFLRHWRGELTLARSYWTNGVCLSLAFYLFSFLITNVLDLGWHYRLLGLFIILMWLMAIALIIWQQTGIWRASVRHMRIHASKFWGIAAILMVLYSAAFLVHTLFAQARPQMEDAFKIAADRDKEGKYTILSLEGGTVLEIYGTIAFGLTDDVQQYLDRWPSVTTISFSSNGGRVAEARKLAQLIEARRLSTTSHSGCYSACVLPFAAGARRFLPPKVLLGFHQYTAPGLGQGYFGLQYKRDKHYLLSRGIDIWFVYKIFEIPPDRLWKPSQKELFEAHYITEYNGR